MKTFFNFLYGAFIGSLVLVGGLFLTSFTRFDTGIDAKVVQSGSMEPAIPVGALVFIAPLASYEAGDVVTFGKDSASAVPTTHRIVNVGSGNGKVMYTT